jgi:hypothetical protein
MRNGKLVKESHFCGSLDFWVGPEVGPYDLEDVADEKITVLVKPFENS